MNFSKINYQSFIGRVLRLPLRLIPKGMVLPILQGRLRGKKWIVGAGEHGYWLGSYELSKRLAFEEHILPGTVIYDIGANVGYYSLLASELTGSEGQVLSFEPLPRNAEFIRRHAALNRMNNVKVIEAAVSDRQGQAFFNQGTSIATGHLAENGEIRVPVVCLDDLVEAGELPPPDTMKVDVEGAEHKALLGAQRLLTRFHPVLFLDTHQRDGHQATIDLLQKLGYTFKILDGKSLTETKELIAYPEQLPRSDLDCAEGRVTIDQGRR